MLLISSKISKDLLEVIDSTKRKLNISIPGYIEPIIQICNKALENQKREKIEMKKYQRLIQGVITFLQEKCKEKDYIFLENFMILFLN